MQFLFTFTRCVFGRPFVKRFALCYQSVVCLSVCLSVCLCVTFVHCGQTVGRIKMKLGVHVGLGPGHIVLDGNPAPPPPKGHSPTQFWPICCGQIAAWIKMPLGMELSPGDFVLDGDPAPLPKRGAEHNIIIKLKNRRLGIIIILRSVIVLMGTISPRGGAWHSYSCGQTVGWIKMPLGKEVGLGPESQTTLC